MNTDWQHQRLGDGRWASRAPAWLERWHEDNPDPYREAYNRLTHEREQAKEAAIARQRYPEHYGIFEADPDNPIIWGPDAPVYDWRQKDMMHTADPAPTVSADACESLGLDFEHGKRREWLEAREEARELVEALGDKATPKLLAKANEPDLWPDLERYRAERADRKLWVWEP